MPKKFYAVKNGRVPGVYNTWDECKKQIHGYGGAVYKSFSDMGEALDFVLDAAKQENDISQGISASEAIAYVDGSYLHKQRRFSYGAVILADGKELAFKKAFDDPEYALMRNVAGEIEGAKFAMEYCIQNGIKSVDIYYDYQGIELWCTGAWKTNKPQTAEYKRYYDEASKKLDIRFKKVKGHSGDKYNDMADALAKSALGI